MLNDGKRIMLHPVLRRVAAKRRQKTLIVIYWL